MKQLDDSGIPCRVLRTEFVCCQSDIEFLCKLHWYIHSILLPLINK